MNRIFAQRFPYGFEGHGLDPHLRNYLLRLGYHFPRLGFSLMGMVRFLLALEGALKNVHLLSGLS